MLSLFTLLYIIMECLYFRPIQHSKAGSGQQLYTILWNPRCRALLYTILYYFGSSPNYYYGTQLLLLQSALNIYQTGQLMSNNHEEMTTMTSSHQPVTDWNKSLCSVVRGWNFSLRLPLWWPHEVTSGAAIKAGGNSEFIITVKPPSEKLQIIYIYVL